MLWCLLYHVPKNIYFNGENFVRTYLLCGFEEWVDETSIQRIGKCRRIIKRDFKTASGNPVGIWHMVSSRKEDVPKPRLTRFRSTCLHVTNFSFVCVQIVFHLLWTLLLSPTNIGRQPFDNCLIPPTDNFSQPTNSLLNLRHQIHVQFSNIKIILYLSINNLL